MAAIALLGMALTTLASGQHWTHVLRVLAVVGAITLASLLMDLGGVRRNRFLLPLVALLASVGIILLSRISGMMATKQILWVLVGCGGLLATYLIVDQVSSLADWKYLAGTAAVALMVITIIWGIERNGARLWLNLGGVVSFQPGELAKVLIAIFLAGYAAEKSLLLRHTGRGRLQFSALHWRYLLPMALMVVLCLGLFVGQRDLGSAGLFFGLFVVMMYLATGSGWHAVASVVLFAGGVPVAYSLFPHVVRRMDAWLRPWEDLHGAGYQPVQGLFALAEGGVSGAGLGLLPVTQRNLPEAGTDMILAVIGQDLGLAGVVGVLLVYVLLFWVGFRIAWRAGEVFEGLLAAGLTSIFALQTLVICGGVLRLIPLTGLPMPLISYGGTAMLVNFIAIGLLLGISRDQEERSGRRG